LFINEKNLGFPIAVNQGIRAAKGEIIIILNNDTLVTPKWLSRFEEHLKYADIVGPVSNNVSGPQKVCEF
jgi:GT2 family glycosyltransferase